LEINLYLEFKKNLLCIDVCIDEVVVVSGKEAYIGEAKIDKK
jgi:hypothetical protein